jgi:hypothetical protein
METRPVAEEMFHADRLTEGLRDRRNDVYCVFSQFCDLAKK